LILSLLEEATGAGARLSKACEVLGLSLRAVQRWRQKGCGEDERRGPKTAPGNKLSDAERDEVLRVVSLPEYRNLPPGQIVPRQAGAEQQLAHRDRSRPRSHRRPKEHIATGPNQVFPWDITYLRTPVRGMFFYLYLVEDVWSRKIVGNAVHDRESSELAADLVQEVMHGLPEGVVLHSDNGSPMKGATLLATLQRLGVVPSYSRPRVSDDNAHLESLFRTMKYRPDYPTGPFADIEQARAWVEHFVHWYNTEHLHSGIRYVTPEDRHAGRGPAIFARRREVYAAARRAHPERWTGATRKWESVREVRLNPARAADAATTNTGPA
jgi:transposase InsO family protein